MRHVILFIVLGLIYASAATAQHVADEDLLIEQAQLGTMQSSANGNPLRGLLLSGVGPSVSVALVSQSGDGNTAFVNQQGQGNKALMQQIGSGNTTLFEQIGNYNSLAARLEGNYNFLSISQRGDDNRYEFDFTGDYLEHSIEQHGTGLSASQTGMARRPFSIEQRGRGAAISIEHNR